MTSTPIAVLRHVTRTFSAPAGDFAALREVDLSLPRGKLIAIVGRSGSGKSTLLNLIAGIDRPTAGELVVAGSALGELDEDGLARWRGKHVGVVFQFFQLLPCLTVLENVLLPMDFAGTLTGRAAQARALELLERMSIADQAHKLPGALSGGQQQRAAIARALANDPELIVADEPTGNLDTQAARQVLELFELEARRGKSVLLVTHERDISARVHHIITLSDGRVIESTLERAA